jgi:hypothetical protein
MPATWVRFRFAFSRQRLKTCGYHTLETYDEGRLAISVVGRMAASTG